MGQKVQFGLENAVNQWPTPAASPYGTSNNGNPHDERTEYATKGKPSLERMVAWPTSTAKDKETNALLGRQVLRAPSTHGSPRAQLNPDWVEVLMGFPVGWTR
jgi:hypothetical protein